MGVNTVVQAVLPGGAGAGVLVGGYVGTAATALRLTGRVWTGVSATLLVLGWLLGGVAGVALGVAGWAGVVAVQMADRAWARVSGESEPAPLPVPDCEM